MQDEGAADFNSSLLLQQAMKGGPSLSGLQQAVGTAFAQGPGITGTQANFSSTCSVLHSGLGT